MASNSILKPSQAEQKVATLLALGSAAEKSIQRLRNELEKADQETRDLLGLERLGRLEGIAVGDQAKDVKEPVPTESAPRTDKPGFVSAPIAV